MQFGLLIQSGFERGKFNETIAAIVPEERGG